MALNIQNNPFKQNDQRLKEEQARQQKGQELQSQEQQSQEPEEGQPRESEFRREEMVQRSLTIANPPSQELVLVLDSAQERDSLCTVLRRFAAQFPAPPSLPAPSK